MTENTSILKIKVPDVADKDERLELIDKQIGNSRSGLYLVDSRGTEQVSAADFAFELSNYFIDIIDTYKKQGYKLKIAFLIDLDNKSMLDRLEYLKEKMEDVDGFDSEAEAEKWLLDG